MNNNYDWNAPLMPGTIVCASYCDFDNEKRVGLFLVLYDEQLDSNVFSKKNVVCIKLSTQTTLVSNYSVKIDMRKNDFLDKNCIACCSKIHLLHKESNVYKILGHLDATTCKNVFKSYFKFVSETQRQFIDRI